MEKETKLYDLAFLNKFTKGDASKMKNYIQTYLRTSSRIFEELEEAGKRGDADGLYVKAHTVKAQVQYMGIHSLQEVLVEIETIARSNPGSGELDDLVNQAMKYYTRSAEELQDHLASQNGETTSHAGV